MDMVLATYWTPRAYHEREPSELFSLWKLWNNRHKGSLKACQPISSNKLVVFALMISETSGTFKSLFTIGTLMANRGVTVMVLDVNSQVCFVLQHFVAIRAGEANRKVWKSRRFCLSVLITLMLPRRRKSSFVGLLWFCILSMIQGFVISQATERLVGSSTFKAFHWNIRFSDIFWEHLYVLWSDGNTRRLLIYKSCHKYYTAPPSTLEWERRVYNGFYFERKKFIQFIETSKICSGSFRCFLCRWTYRLGLLPYTLPHKSQGKLAKNIHNRDALLSFEQHVAVISLKKDTNSCFQW